MQQTRVRRGASVLSAMAVAALLVAGCGSSDKDDAATTTTTTTATTTTAAPSTSSSTTTTTIVTGTSSPGVTSPGNTTAPPTTAAGGPPTSAGDSKTDTLPDGDHYVYFKGAKQGQVEGQQVTLLTFDKVDFLTGKAAVDAAHEDGAIPEDQDSVDNDYYIRNKNKLLRTIAVVPDAQVFTLGCDGGCSEQKASSATEVATQPYLFKILVQNVRGLTTITSIEAVFLP